MKLEKGKKVVEPMKEKKGPKLKAERTIQTKVKQKESTGNKVKSKMKVEKGAKKNGY